MPDKKALSLMEIIVAIVLLALVMLGFANLFIAGKRWILHSRARMTGGELGKYFLDPLQMQVSQEQWGNNCLSNSSLCSPASTTIDTINYNATYNTADVADTTLRKVRLNLGWNETKPTP